jgi:hypothetical protein
MLYCYGILYLFVRLNMQLIIPSVSGKVRMPVCGFEYRYRISGKNVPVQPVNIPGGCGQERHGT